MAPDRRQLTEELIAGLRAMTGDAAKPYLVWDTKVPKMRVHVSVKGKRTFQVSRDRTTLTLGDCGTLKLAEARKLAVAPSATMQAIRTIPERRTIRTYVDLYLATDADGLAKNTRRPRVVRHFLAPILDQPLAALTQKWVIDRQKELLSEPYGTRDGEDVCYAGSTVRLYQKATATFAAWLVEHEHIARTPFRKLPKIPVDEKFYFLDDRGMTNMVAACARYEEPRMACLAAIAMGCGLRRNEIMNLTWDDFDWTREPPRITVRARTSKTKKGRPVPIPASVVELLHKRRHELSLKRPFQIASPHRLFKKLREFASLDQHITIHGLRHTYATKLLRQGVPIAKISKLLGHSNIEITMRYLHILDAELFSSAAKIDEYDRPYLPPAHLRGGGE